MSHDDGIRAKAGLVVCFRKDENKKIRIIFDDVKSDSTENPESWMPEQFFTWVSCSEDKLKNLDFTEDEYAEIGFNVLSRLVAIDKHS